MLFTHPPGCCATIHVILQSAPINDESENYVANLRRRERQGRGPARSRNRRLHIGGLMPFASAVMLPAMILPSGCFAPSTTT